MVVKYITQKVNMMTQEQNTAEMIERAVNGYWANARVSIVSVNDETKKVTLVLQTSDGKTYKTVLD